MRSLVLLCVRATGYLIFRIKLPLRYLIVLTAPFDLFLAPVISPTDFPPLIT